jgi:hypothetical protein
MVMREMIVKATTSGFFLILITGFINLLTIYRSLMKTINEELRKKLLHIGSMVVNNLEHGQRLNRSRLGEVQGMSDLGYT